MEQSYLPASNDTIYMELNYMQHTFYKGCWPSSKLAKHDHKKDVWNLISVFEPFQSWNLLLAVSSFSLRAQRPSSPL